MMNPVFEIIKVIHDVKIATNTGCDSPTIMMRTLKKLFVLMTAKHSSEVLLRRRSFVADGTTVE